MKQVKSHIEELRARKYPCAQATLLGIARGTGASMPDEKTLMAITAGLRGGIGRTYNEGTCGALTGATVALGLLFPDDEEKAIALSNELFKGFSQEFGTVICGKITNEYCLKRCTECCIKAGCLAACLYQRETMCYNNNIPND